MIVLNVGSGGISCLGNPIYQYWDEKTLDLDPRAEPDFLGDVRYMPLVGRYDAVYCSHNLEHYLPRDVKIVLDRFVGLLLLTKGFAHIIVPDIMSVMRAADTGGMDVSSQLYVSPAGPITVHDVIYGYGKEIDSGHAHFMHKTGFSPESLTKAMHGAGFKNVYLARQPEIFQVQAFGFVAEPTEEQMDTIQGKQHEIS